MASAKLMTSKSKAPYFKLTANVTVRGNPERRYGRYDFDPKVVKTQKARLAAANAAAVLFEMKEQEQIDAQEKGYGKSFREVAQECIDSMRSEMGPSVRLEGDFESQRNKLNTTLNKEMYLQKICELSDFGEKPIGTITKEDCSNVLKKMEKGGIRGEHLGYAVLTPDGKSYKVGTCPKIAKKAGVTVDEVERAFRGCHILPKYARKIAAGLEQPLENVFEIHLDKRPLKRKTIKEYANFMRLVMAYACDKYHINNDVYSLKVLGAKRTGVDCLHDDEVAALQKILPACSMTEQALIYTFMNTGIRRGELAGLMWKDFDFENCTVHIERSLLVFPDVGYQLTTTKEDNIRDVDVAPEYMAFMKDYYKHWQTLKKLMGASWQTNVDMKWDRFADSLLALSGKDFVICTDHGFPMNPGSYGKIVSRLGAKAGIAKLHPHKFRHTFVSILLSNPDIGVATVAAEAGHAQPSTTLAIYTQVYKKRRKEIQQQLSQELYGGRTGKTKK